jgi:hypothetical protein
MSVQLQMAKDLNEDKLEVLSNQMPVTLPWSPGCYGASKS